MRTIAAIIMAFFLVLVFLSGHAFGQQQFPAVVIAFPSTPTGPCGTPGVFALNKTNGDLYDCKDGAWHLTTPGSTGAPNNATYITQTPDATLTNEQALSLLSTGILKSTTGTGVVSIAAGGTDYEFPLTFSSPLSRATNTVSCPTCETTLTFNAPLSRSGSTVSLTTPLALQYGGTHADLSLTGGTSKVLQQSSAGADITVSQLACSDLSTASGGCSMSTTAGGDLSGTLPSPTVAKVDGVSYPAGPSTNTVPVVTGANTVTYEAVPNAALANSAITINGTSVSLGGTRSLVLNSSDFANEGTTTTVLHGAAAGNPSFGAVVSADLNITTTTCTNQFIRSLSSGAVGTCATVTNSDLSSATITLNSGTNFGITAPGAMTLGNTYTIGATTDNLRFNSASLGDGSASAPSLFLTSESNSGLFYNTGVSGYSWTFTNAGTQRAKFSPSNGWLLSSQTAAKYAWSSSSTAGAAADTALARNTAGIVEVNNGTAGTFRDIAVRNTLLEGTTSGTLTLTTPATTTSYTLTLPSSGGTNTYAMTTNGSGTASWVDGQSISGLTTSSTPQFARMGLGTAAIAAPDLLTVGSGSSNARINVTVAAEASTNGFQITDGAVMENIYSGSGGFLAIAVSGTDGIYVRSDGSVRFPNVTQSTSSSLHDACFGTTNHDLIEDTNLCIVSGRQYKNTIDDLDFGLDFIKQLQPKSYWLNDAPEDGQQFGLIAQDVEKLDNRFVTYEKDGKTPRSVKYIQLIPVLIRAVQELEAQQAKGHGY